MRIGTATKRYVSTGLGCAALLVWLISACSNPSGVSHHEFVGWSDYLGDPGRRHYSSLDQIHVDNVNELEIAWTFSTGDAIEGRTEIECNPIVVDGILYGTTAQLKAFALRADTGELLWIFDPFEGEEPASRGRNRGVAYWTDGQGSNRILYVAGSRLYSVDAQTGRPAEEFGENGSVDFTVGLMLDSLDFPGREGSTSITASSPGATFGDLLIQGSTVYGRAPGYLRAFNVRTGELAWVFHAIPHPGEFGYMTWPRDAWRSVGNANSWAGVTVDVERGIVYVPTASPGDDFYGGDRVGDNLFGSSLVALDAATGERIWHYQIVRHDIWDRDLPAPPTLVTIRRGGRQIDAVAQITKTGHIFVFDRETGDSIFPIEEMPVPRSDIPGEVTSPTQPIPTKPAPFARQEFREEDITAISKEAHEAVLERFRTLRKGNLWTPPSLEGTLVFPGTDGGAEWGGAAFDPETRVLYVNNNEMPFTITMVETETSAPGMTPGRRFYNNECSSCHGINRDGDPPLTGIHEKYSAREIESIVRNGQGMMPPFGHLDDVQIREIISYLENPEANEESDNYADSEETPMRPRFTHTGYIPFVDPEGYPAIKPPWGTLSAVDLDTGEYLWQIPLGELEELTARGIPPTGTNNYGGPVVTAGGIVFIAATKDEKFRAIDKRTGEVLWETKLPAAGYATPAVYEVDGKQHVVIAAGGGKLGTRSGDTYVAFALPDD